MRSNEHRKYPSSWTPACPPSSSLRFSLYFLSWKLLGVDSIDRHSLFLWLPGKFNGVEHMIKFEGRQRSRSGYFKLWLPTSD